MNTNRVVRILFTLFICLITSKDAAKTPKTKSTDSAKQTGFLLYISKLMAPKEVVPIKMVSIRRDTLTYVKMRMLYYFQRLDHELFLDKKFSKTKILERVPSKGIRLSLQWQDIKSAWGLPLARSHLGLYVLEERKWFGLYTRNFRRPLKRIKNAFFKVLNLYGERIQEHFTKKTHTIHDVFDVKINAESEKLLILDKYNIYKETKELLNDLPPARTFWSPGEMTIFNEFCEMYGKPPIEVPQEAGDWDEGWDDEEEEKDKSSSGTDYYSDDERFRLPPESDNSDISDKENEKTAIEDELEEKIQEIAKKESETETKPEIRPEPVPRTETAPTIASAPTLKSVTRTQPPAPGTTTVLRTAHETSRVGNPAESESETESESDHETARTHSKQTDEPGFYEPHKSEEAPKEILANVHSLPPPPSDKISHDEMKDIREGPGEYLRTVNKLESEITKIVCDAERRKIIAELDQTLKTIPSQCEDLEKSKQHSHHQTTAHHPSSNDAGGISTAKGGLSFFGGGLGLGSVTLPHSVPKPDGMGSKPPPSELAKPHEAGKEALHTAVTEPSHHHASPTSTEHPTTDAVLNTPPEPKEHEQGDDDDEWTTDDESEESDKEHSYSPTPQTKTPETAPISKHENLAVAIPSATPHQQPTSKPETPATAALSATHKQPLGSQAPTSTPFQQLFVLRNLKPINVGNSNPTESNLRSFQFETTENLEDGKKMHIKTEGHWSIEPKLSVSDVKYNVHHASNSGNSELQSKLLIPFQLQRAVQPVSMIDAKIEVFQKPPENNWWQSTTDTKKARENSSENTWWLPSISDWFA